MPPPSPTSSSLRPLAAGVPPPPGGADTTGAVWVEGLLEPDASQAEALLATLDRFTRACAAVAATGRRERTAGNARLHHLCYAALRADYGLHANLAVRAIARAARLLKGAGLSEGAADVDVPASELELDARVFRLSTCTRSVSLATVRGRVRGVPLRVSPVALPLLRGRRPTRALVWRSQEGTFRVRMHLVPEHADV